MVTITVLYINCVNSIFDTKFIADVFDKNGIAKVSKVYIEPYKSNIKNYKHHIYNNYNDVYVFIEYWYNTEAAYNFIECLRNPNVQAKIKYDNDNWWVVNINFNHSKL
jgi:hypothetical protein